MIEFILPFLIALVIVLLATPPTIVLAKKFGLVDDPHTHKHPAIVHTKPVPRAGGVPIFIGIFLSVLIFIPITPALLAVLMAGFLVTFIGVLDDKYDLSPYIRIVTNIISALIVVIAGITVPFTTNPFGGILHFNTIGGPFLGPIGSFIPGILAVVWIVWVMNMLNWSKGVDGQMPGIASIAALVIGIASLRFGVTDQPSTIVATLSFIVAGASLGFLFYNFYPAKIFPGYSATILGFTIGILSVMSSVKLATAVLVMGVPTADALFTIVRRVLAKKSPFWHDRGHLHHHLLNMGWGHRRIALFYWSVSILLGMIALGLNSKGKLFAIILVLVIVWMFLLTLKHYLKNKSI